MPYAYYSYDFTEVTPDMTVIFATSEGLSFGVSEKFKTNKSLSECLYAATDGELQKEVNSVVGALEGTESRLLSIGAKGLPSVGQLYVLTLATNAKEITNSLFSRLKHWLNPNKVEVDPEYNLSQIESGLSRIADVVSQQGVKCLAIENPVFGGKQHDKVKDLFIKQLSLRQELRDVDIVYIAKEGDATPAHRRYIIERGVGHS